MDFRAPAIALAAGRVAYGAGLTVAPRLAAGVWVGRQARDPGTQVLARGLGIRDLALGAGTLLSLQRGDFGRPRWWLAAQALSDATDLLATVAARSALPPGRRWATAGLAAGSTAIGVAAIAGGVGEAPGPPAATV